MRKEAYVPVNLDRLTEEGVIQGPLWSVYADVVANLSDEEVDALVSVKKKLDEAAAAAGREPAEYSINLGIII